MKAALKRLLSIFVIPLLALTMPLWALPMWIITGKRFVDIYEAVFTWFESA